jgi:YVTN family beta-propeller protein
MGSVPHFPQAYCANEGSDDVTVIDGATNAVLATVTAGNGPRALCHNPQNNKVYSANYLSDNVTVIDGATNQVLATVTAGNGPRAICYNPQNNKVYCANDSSGSVTVIDGASNQVLRTLGVGDGPCDFTWNPAQNRVYVANYQSSSISVLRDSGGGIEESPKPHGASSKLTATIVRGVLFLPAATGPGPRASSILLDITGRNVMELRPGPNDVGRLAPGVYFVYEVPQAASLKLQAVRKVVIQR